MRRREFTALLGATLVWPLTARADQSMPVVGFLRSTPAAPFTELVAAFNRGLGQSGFVDGRNVRLEYRYADNQLNRLPALAADLINQGAAVIVANSVAAKAVKEATQTVSLVFVSGDDPVEMGLVKSLAHPGDNATGVTFFGGGQLNEKRLQLLRDLVPDAKVIALLIDVSYTRALGADLSSIEAVGNAMGIRIAFVRTERTREFERVFEDIVQTGARALLVSGSPLFTASRDKLVALAAQYRLPAIYDQEIYVRAGGLASYASSFTGAYEEAGHYAAMILKGAKPADLPVQQPTTFELAINQTTAKALGIAVPEAILSRADEVFD